MGASSGPAGSGVTGSSKWCLNTVDEVSAAVGTAVTAAVGTDAGAAGGACAYTAGNVPVLAISVVTGAPSGTFDAFKGTQGAETLTGIGDAAVLVTAQGPLAFIKGTTVVSMTIVPTATMADAAKIKSALETLAKAAAGRI